MHTNIDTKHAMGELDYFFNNSPFIDDLHCNAHNKAALLQAIKITMKNKIFKFDNAHWTQNSGTAMDTPPGTNQLR